MSQNQRGGPREGAGRKSNSELQLARDSIDQCVTPEDWKKVWTRLLDIIDKDETSGHKIRAARLLCEYRFGKPTAVVEYSEDAPQTTDSPASAKVEAPSHH